MSRLARFVPLALEIACCCMAVGALALWNRVLALFVAGVLVIVAAALLQQGDVL